MKIAVLLGGISKEREISLRSGKRIAQALRKMGHNVDEIDVKEDFVYNIRILKQYDAVFNILHGTFGEDGRMQSILDVLGIPYTGSGVEASVLAFDKYLCNLFVERLSKDVLVVPKFLLVQEDKFHEDTISNIISSIGMPCVVKPRNEGSSIGTHVCFTVDEFEKSLKEELKNYGEAIVQEYIKGKEITVSIIDINKIPTVLPILELRPKKLFYDYEAKYTDGMTEFILPADLDEILSERIKETALDIYKSMGCKHFARVDGIVRDGRFYFLEVNTLPGMTELSDLPMSAKAYGIDFEKLVDIIITEAYKNPPFGLSKRGATR
uniref:D-alanine--D-alanine ligase n=1 Tax=Fervidobacterium nodosum TaxID=2424 RepID=A0A7C5U8Q7_9BACT